MSWLRTLFTKSQKKNSKEKEGYFVVEIDEVVDQIARTYHYFYEQERYIAFLQYIKYEGYIVKDKEGILYVFLENYGIICDEKRNTRNNTTMPGVF